jgi:hypothetical protein
MLYFNDLLPLINQDVFYNSVVKDWLNQLLDVGPKPKEGLSSL